MIHSPFSLNKMSYKRKSGMVIYQSMMPTTLKRNYQLIPASKWLRILTN